MAEVFQIISDYKTLYLMKKRRNGIIDDEINIGYMEVKHTFKISDPWIEIVDLALSRSCHFTEAPEMQLWESVSGE